MWNECEVRVALFGIRGVGKSAIIFRYMNGTFSDKYDPSTGEDYRLPIDLGECQFGMHIIDAIGANSETFPMTECFLMTCSAIGFVYSITSPQSFEWVPVGMEKIRRLRDSDTPFIAIIIANKADLEHSRKISVEDGIMLAEKYNALYIEASAKFNINVGRIFATLSNRIDNDDLLLNYNPYDKKKSVNKKCCIAYLLLCSYEIKGKSIFVCEFFLEMRLQGDLTSSIWHNFHSCN